jgi:hypothetical protein
MSTTTFQVGVKFNEQDAHFANLEWGANCGPGALAAILDKTLADIRPIVEQVDFHSRGYMNVTMMRKAIELAGAKITLPHVCSKLQPAACFAWHGLVRLQWTGPWIITDASGKQKAARWAATATHWVASWKFDSGPNQQHYIFDINGGVMRYDEWVSQVVPAITASIKRADGGWYPTHSWEIESP